MTTSAQLTDLTYNARRHAYSRTEDYLFAQLIPYIGSKRKLLPLISRALARVNTTPPATFLDLFAGSGVVARLAKSRGYRVIANDWEPYAATLNGAFIGLNEPPIPPSIFDELNALAPIEGFIARHYCPANDALSDPLRERMFYTRANGMKIDAIRSQIRAWECDGTLTVSQRDYLLAPLLSAASYVANTSGVFKAYHHGWGGRTQTAHYRILSNLAVAPPTLCDNGLVNTVTRLDAQTLAERFAQTGGERDSIAYLDPPYNQHPYGSNYHLLNTIALYDEPEVPSLARGGKSAIRTDWRDSRRSAFNHPAFALPALENLLDTLPSRWILMSYSTDGNIPLPSLLAAFAQRGTLAVEPHRYKRYRVSTPRMSARSHNVEFVLILDRDGAGDANAADQCAAEIAAAEG